MLAEELLRLQSEAKQAKESARFQRDARQKLDVELQEARDTIDKLNKGAHTELRDFFDFIEDREYTDRLDWRPSEVLDLITEFRKIRAAGKLPKYQR